MKLIVPTNWDDKLVPELERLGVAECYGKLALDAVGGGRSAFILPNVGRKKAAAHIRLLHESGMSFNYLLNASCSLFREFTRTGYAGIQELLRWLVRAEVDTVTVASPFLAQMIQADYPELKICVSTNAEVDSVQRAVFWDRLGAAQITLSHISMNRDFNLIRLIRKAVGCELRLIANTSCLFHCPLARYHSSFDAHSSQTGCASRAGFSVDYCNLLCKLIRLTEPAQFIRSQWIRPEDLGRYESAGIDGVKLIDRRCSTEKLVRIAGSYARRSHAGNLLDLLTMFHGKTPLSARTLFLKLKFFFHPCEFNILEFFELNEILQDFKIHLDNGKLSGFIDKFTVESCSLNNCASCGYCERVAGQALSYDRGYLEDLKKRHGKFLNRFVRGELFHY